VCPQAPEGSLDSAIGIHFMIDALRHNTGRSCIGTSRSFNGNVVPVPHSLLGVPSLCVPLAGVRSSKLAGHLVFWQGLLSGSCPVLPIPYRMKSVVPWCLSLCFLSSSCRGILRLLLCSVDPPEPENCSGGCRLILCGTSPETLLRKGLLFRYLAASIAS